MSSYDLITQKGEVMPEMNDARFDFTSILFGKYIYVMGGGYGSSEEILKSTER